MERRPHIAWAIALVWVLVACAGPEADSPTEPLPLQEAGLVLGGDVEATATKVGEYALSEAELEDLEEECQDAQGIPLEDGAPCLTVLESRRPSPCGRFEICLEVFEVREAEFASAGYVEVSDRRQSGSRCDADPDAVCLRVGVTDGALEQVTTSTGEPSETPTESPTGTSTETPTPSSTVSPSGTLPGTPGETLSQTHFETPAGTDAASPTASAAP